MNISITITDEEIKAVCEELNLDFKNQEIVDIVRSDIADGIRTHIDMRDWSLSELVVLEEIQGSDYVIDIATPE